MADAIETAAPSTPEAQEEKMLPSSTVNKLIRERLERQAQQHNSEKQALMDQLAQSQGQPQAAPQSQVEPSQPQQLPQTPGQPDIRSIMQDEFRKNQEKQQQQRFDSAIAHHKNAIAKMSDGDEDFKNLVSKTGNTTGLGIPPEMAIALTNKLDHETAKKTIKDLLTNRHLNLEMENAHLKGNYDDWLNKLMNSKPSDNKNPAWEVPDLKSQSSTSDLEPEDENMINYIKNMRK